MPSNKYLLPFILVTSLFFLWGIVNSLNGVLISHFQPALNLNRLQAALVDSAFYLGYFVMAIPAGLFMNRYGFRKGIIFGLLLYALGAMLFYPAAEVRVYSFFLFNLFTIAGGLAFLETAANPYVSILGDPAKAEQRLNFSQSFNGLSIILGPMLGSLLIFTDRQYTQAELAALPPAQAEQIRIEEALTVQTPYLGLAMVVLLVALLFWLVKMPEPTQPSTSGKRGWEGIFKNRHLVLGVVAQFCYVGAQTCLWGFFIDLKMALSPDKHFFLVEAMKPFFEWLAGSAEDLTPKRWAGFHLSFSFILFMLGRFIGTWLMSFFKPNRLLTVFAIASFALFLFGILADGLSAVVAIMFSSFFMSIMFPTIFALGTKNLGEQVKIGSSLIIMAIVGGAVMPPVLGLIADATKNYQAAFVLPALCFIMIGYYGWRGYRVTGTMTE
jgi:FHS family L-fucose permease-like MFS transporter